MYWLFMYASKFIFSKTNIVKPIDCKAKKQFKFTELPAGCERGERKCTDERNYIAGKIQENLFFK